MGMEAAHLRQSRCPHRPRHRQEDENQRWDTDHRSRLALSEGQDQTEPKVYSGVITYAGEDPQCPV